MSFISIAIQSNSKNNNVIGGLETSANVAIGGNQPSDIINKFPDTGLSSIVKKAYRPKRLQCSTEDNGH